MIKIFVFAACCLTFFTFSGEINTSFEIQPYARYNKLRISLNNTSSDTLLITPRVYFPKKVFKGKCRNGKLDFIFSESGVNLYDHFYIDDGPRPIADRLDPGAKRILEMKYDRNLDCSDTCFLVFRIFNPQKQEGVKYLVALNAVEKVVNKVRISSFYE